MPVTFSACATELAGGCFSRVFADTMPALGQDSLRGQDIAQHLSPPHNLAKAFFLDLLHAAPQEQPVHCAGVSHSSCTQQPFLQMLVNEDRLHGAAQWSRNRITFVYHIPCPG